MKKLLQFSALAFALSLGMYTNAQIEDASFDAGPGSGAWIEASTNFGTPLCDEASCGTCGGECVPKNGVFYAWFGGADTVETASVEQTAIFPSGSVVSLDVDIKIAAPGPGLIDDRLVISVDGTALATVTAHDSAAYVAYTKLSIDVSSLADGGSHLVKIEGFQTTATSFNILADDAYLIVDGIQVGLFEDVMEPKFKVYPNPASDVINLTFGEATGEAIVTIVSIDGKEVSNETVSNVFNKSFEFKTLGLDNGVYIVNVTNNNTTTSQRVVISK
ncbi:MAG: hypothetical protein ACI9XP_000440 [Lentimonas sp.]|jgi:hypothetical protein